jgi:hypothetical protein
MLVWIVLALLALLALSRLESYENLMYPGQPARFFDTDSRGNQLRWAARDSE